MGTASIKLKVPDIKKRFLRGESRVDVFQDVCIVQMLRFDNNVVAQ